MRQANLRAMQEAQRVPQLAASASAGDTAAAAQA
jgi:hypothetical protein